MNKCRSIEGYEVNYDEWMDKIDYRIPEALFGLMYEFIEPGENILDIGTGTGRVAKLFYKAGLQVNGLDKSAKMLEICAEKLEYSSLKQHDLLEVPYPYDTGYMDHISCVGVVNHFDNLEVLFSECSRIIRTGGYFGFMTGAADIKIIDINVPEDKSSEVSVNDCISTQTDEEIKAYLPGNSFELCRTLISKVNSSRYPDLIMPIKFYVVRKV